MRQILRDAGTTVLDGDGFETHGIGDRRREGIRRRLRAARVGGVGRSHYSSSSSVKRSMKTLKSRPRSPGCRPCRSSPYCTTRQCSRPWRASRWKSIHFWARAASRNPSTPITWRWSSTATPIAVICRRHEHRDPGLQRLDAGADARVCGSAAVSGVRDSCGRCHHHHSESQRITRFTARRDLPPTHRDPSVERRSTERRH